MYVMSFLTSEKNIGGQFHEGVLFSISHCSLGFCQVCQGYKLFTKTDVTSEFLCYFFSSLFRCCCPVARKERVFVCRWTARANQSAITVHRLTSTRKFESSSVFKLPTKDTNIPLFDLVYFCFTWRLHLYVFFLRNGKKSMSIPIDTLFDEDSIISNAIQ